MGKLQFSGFSPGHTRAPPPPPNGGLYTGRPFPEGAAYRNFPATPDAAFLQLVNLQSAKPPPGATLQPPGQLRPGNSGFDAPMPQFRQYTDNYNVFCIRPSNCGLGKSYSV